jgi:hypothetical protein
MEIGLRRRRGNKVLVLNVDFGWIYVFINANLRSSIWTMTGRPTVAAHLRGGPGDEPPRQTSAASPAILATAHDGRVTCSRRLGCAQPTTRYRASRVLQSTYPRAFPLVQGPPRRATGSGPTHDSAASIPWGRDGGTPAGIPDTALGTGIHSVPDSGCGDSFFCSCPCTFLLAISHTRSGAMTSATLSRALLSAEARC